MADSHSNIVAVATPPGYGGVSIVRLSGPNIPELSVSLIGKLPSPRYAALTNFFDDHGNPIDHGIALYFPAPNSFTGEHVLEFHGHGSPMVTQMLLARCLSLGMRLARPGEFSERAFLNGRLDLTQAEAIADLIESSTESAARSAFNSLQGGFSDRIHNLTEKVTNLRIYVEAAIDFPDEEIDFLEDGEVLSKVHDLVEDFESLKSTLAQGKLLRDGLKVVLTGRPNAGKSSLLNLMCDEQRAIVSAIAGTTRDVLTQTIELDGLPVELLDTAGIRDSSDEIEEEGVRRAFLAQQQSDLILLVVDDSDHHETVSDLVQKLPENIPYLVVHNKIDLSGNAHEHKGNHVWISAATGEGIPTLIEAIKKGAGYRGEEGSQIIARQRHIDAIHRAEGFLLSGLEQLTYYNAGELLAEDLAACQQVLGEITGKVTSDELLGLIFGSFCIGK